MNPFTLEGDLLYKEKPDNSTKNGMLKQDLIKLQLFDSNDKNTFAGMSTEYIAQRADMLKLTMESNWDKLSKTHNNTVYIDIDANIAVTHTIIPDKNIYDTNPPHTPKPGNTGVTEQKKVAFGSEDDKRPDILTGGKLDDFLFAGAGDDTMEGKE